MKNYAGRGTEISNEEMMVRVLTVVFGSSPRLRHKVLGLSPDDINRRAMSPLMRLPLSSRDAIHASPSAGPMAQTPAGMGDSGPEFRMCRLCFYCRDPLVFDTFDLRRFICMSCWTPVLRTG